MDKGAWWTTAHEMAESRTRLNNKAQHTHTHVRVYIYMYTNNKQSKIENNNIYSVLNRKHLGITNQRCVGFVL